MTFTPVPSEEVADLLENTKTEDIVVNSDDPTTVTRTGKVVRTFAGINAAYDSAEAARNIEFQQFLAASGLEYPPLVYVDGVPLQVDRSTQTIERAGNIYSVKVPNTFPFVLTGIFATDAPNLVLRNDLALRTEIAAPAGSGLVGYDQGGAGSVPTTVENKLQQIISVVDKGAIEGGLINNTASFLAAGIDSYVPEGNWLVDADEIEVSRFWGPGKLLTTGGAVIALKTDVQGSHYVMRKVMEPFYGFNNGVTNTEIYAGAQFAPQGLAYHRDPITGVQRMFISQSVGIGADWGPDEYVRITEFLMREDGGIQNNTQFTPELRSSHAHLSALTDTDGKLYMYQSWRAPIGTVGLNAEVGKGWSKMEWKGVGNVDADIINYQVWGDPGTGHRYQYYGKGCVQVSQDGKYMILIGINYVGGAGGRTLFVYDRKKVEAMADPLLAEPIFVSRPLDAMLADGEIAYQGETCDGRYIYICWGSGSTFGRRGVTIYTLTGEKIRDVFMDGPASQYTDAELFNHPTLGAATAFEPEGITIRGDEVFVTFTDFFREDPDVVVWEGVNYSNLQINNIGQQPDQDQIHWKITTKAATRGTWDPLSTYVVGNTTKRSKIIYSIMPVRGAPGELPCSTSYTYPASVAQYPGNAAILINASHDLGSTWRVGAHVVPTDSYRSSFDYRFGYTFAVFDQRAGADNTVRAALRMSTTGGSHIASVIAGDGTSAGGAYLNLYASTSPSTPGEARLSSSGLTSSVRIMQNGATKIQVTDTENVIYQTERPLTTQAFTFGTAAREWADMFSVKGTFSGPVKVGKYTLATLPSASAFNGYMIDVTDATGGPKTCRSNGTVWQILNTTTTVS